MSIEIGGVRVEPGHFVAGTIKVAELSHRGEMSIPLLVVCGSSPGPVLWLNGAVHGDELNGPMAIRNLLPTLDPHQLSGSIIATPISNPPAFHARQKNTPQDGLDMNMQFPGDPRGTLSQRMAYLLFELIKEHASYLIDFHTLSTAYHSQPYNVIKKLPGHEAVFMQAEKLAHSFGAYANCYVDFSGSLNELPGNVNGFLDVQCQLHDIPSVMVEIGSGGQLQPEMMAWGERGIMAVLHQLGMWPTAPSPCPVSSPIRITGRRFLYADGAGICTDFAPVGSIVKQGEVICRIVDMLDVVQEVRSEQDCYILAHRRNPPVDTGDRVAFVGTAWE
ncbi:M14 family metallopeptidase [Paenibacillus sanguinis]|uniref:M14 family metallopeptidase n=1 Tax=Paenibacillus sanguinis TaxID=225906 RepID=UPI00037910F7|nr:M14 family metallopeptidase [Paenibacillus sanguinis]